METFNTRSQNTFSMDFPNGQIKYNANLKQSLPERNTFIYGALFKKLKDTLNKYIIKTTLKIYKRQMT